MNNLIRTVRPKFLNRRQSRFQKEHETCVLCNSALVLKFEQVHDEKTKSTIVREIAECPACSIRARSTDHSIQ